MGMEGRTAGRDQTLVPDSRHADNSPSPQGAATYHRGESRIGLSLPWSWLATRPALPPLAATTHLPKCPVALVARKRPRLVMHSTLVLPVR